MSDLRAESITALSWGMLLAGAGLSGFGLFRTLLRHRNWRTAALDGEGEIVLGDANLRIGQQVSIVPRHRREVSEAFPEVSGAIHEICRRELVVSLDRECAGASSIRSTEYGLGGVGAATRNDIPRWPFVGAEATVNVTSLSELYRFSSRVRDIVSTASGLRIALTRPSMLTRLQQRRHVRTALTVPATFERVLAPQSRAELRSGRSLPRGGTLHGTVRDMSGGGLRAHIGGVAGVQQLDRTLALFEPESTVRIGLPFPALPRNAVFARVRSSAKAAVSGGLTVELACEFLPMPAWEQEIVIQHVFQFQREQLRNRKLARNDSKSGIRK